MAALDRTMHEPDMWLRKALSGHSLGLEKDIIGSCAQQFMAPQKKLNDVYNASVICSNVN